MQPARHEGSLLASLSELRAIEHQRVSEEHAMIQRVAEARAREHEDAERRVRDAEAARHAAEHEAKVAVERAREQAEREARMYVEATEAAERARHMVALEAERVASEQQLRREVALRQRPRWMIALTVAAVAAAVALGVFAVDRLRESDAAQAKAQASDRIRQQAVSEANAAREQLEKLSKELAELDQRVQQAIDQVVVAQNDADRKAARDRLNALQRDQAEARERFNKAEQVRLHNERIKTIKIDKDCEDNSLSKKPEKCLK
jgi:hypothetical protein